MEDKKKIISDYIVACIGDFAVEYKLSLKESFRYLDKYQGIAFLEKYYETLHTMFFDEVVYDLFKICKNNGGFIQ